MPYTVMDGAVQSNPINTSTCIHTKGLYMVFVYNYPNLYRELSYPDIF